jgi:hypothetical protein
MLNYLRRGLNINDDAPRAQPWTWSSSTSSSLQDPDKHDDYEVETRGEMVPISASHNFVPVEQLIITKLRNAATIFIDWKTFK